MPSLRSTPLVAAVAITVLAASCLTRAARAQDTTRRGVTIGLTYDPSARPGIAMLPVPGESGDSVLAIVQRDLDFSDRFTVIRLDAADPSAFRPTTAGAALNYPVFARLGAAAVIQASRTSDGVHVALHDVARGAVVNVADFPIASAALSEQWRLAVHGVSDEIERWITGQKGIAATRIAYVRKQTLHVVDSDGAGDMAIGASAGALSPSWSADGGSIAYATFGTSSHVMVHDLRTGRSRSLRNATPGGSNLSPVFSPDGASIVYAHADDDGSDLYIVSPFDDAPARRISVGRGSDNVQPSFSPDGRRIAFTSGRGGHPEIYVMDADGTNVQLLTSFDFGDRNYRTDPDWSPDGRLVAFQSRFTDGRFQIMTISLRDRGTKLLTSDGSNEQPTWAPDGRHLVFASTRSGVRQLWVIDTESGRLRQVTRGGGGSLPSWSRRLITETRPAGTSR